jgi:hypothetical protein
MFDCGMNLIRLAIVDFEPPPAPPLEGSFEAGTVALEAARARLQANAR